MTAAISSVSKNTLVNQARRGRYSAISQLLRKIVDGEALRDLTTDEIDILDGITATTAEINAAADVSARHVAIADADYTVLAANSGKTHTIANVSADRTITLPAASAGLEFIFVAEVGAADGHDWIFAAADTADLFKGGLMVVDTDAGPAVASAVVADQSDDDQLQVNLPQGGTTIRMVCDGTYWIVSGVVMSTAVPVFS